MNSKRSGWVVLAASVVTVVGLQACGDDDEPAAYVPPVDAGVDGKAGSGGGGGAAGTGGVAGSAGQAGSLGESFESAWKKAGSTGSQVNSEESAIPGQSQNDQAPIIVDADGEFTEAKTTFSVHYRFAEAIKVVYVSPTSADPLYRFEVATSQAQSATDTASFEVSIPLPSSLGGFAKQGVDVPVALAIADASQRVSNSVLLQLKITQDATTKAIQGSLKTKEFCQTSAPPYCFLTTAVSCASDGMSYNLKTCISPEKCEDGVCACPADSCTIEGRECGTSSCGTDCGTCPPAGEPTKTYCNQQGLCVEDPSLVGCSDGTREGFVDRSIYPTIASCSATWAEQSLRATRTGQSCGNSLGDCTVPEDACATGWHSCMKNGWPGDLTSRISGDDCRSTVAGPARYLAASSRITESYTCGPPLTCHSSSYPAPVCCGEACTLSSSYNSCVWPSQTPHSSVGKCNSVGSSTMGVLCCQDPPITGY